LHLNDWKSLPWRAARDRQNGAEIVDALGGNGSLFRPPYGKLTLYGLLSGFLAGTRFAFWTLDTQDSWKPRPIPEIISELVEARGGVVLLHDFDRDKKGRSRASSAEYVLTLTEQLIQTAKAEGLTLVRFGDLQRWKTA
jgi:peptidoglycan/xylan/chitin deacetylase (PgdA/CDA1 family)